MSIFRKYKTLDDVERWVEVINKLLEIRSRSSKGEVALITQAIKRAEEALLSLKGKR